MTSGAITLQGFHFSVVDGHGSKIVDGKESGTKPVKILSFRDAHSGLQINIVMSLEAYEKYIATLTESKIVPASFVPNPPHLTRNGGQKRR
jgi:hypothetical protein